MLATLKEHLIASQDLVSQTDAAYRSEFARITDIPRAGREALVAAIRNVPNGEDDTEDWDCVYAYALLEARDYGISIKELQDSDSKIVITPCRLGFDYKYTFPKYLVRRSRFRGRCRQTSSDDGDG
jgi:hypothetical protein